MHRLFHPHSGFLSSTLANPEGSGKTRAVSTEFGTWCHQSPGILTFHCETLTDEHVIISAGIHGNETAPIEMLDRIVNATFTGELQPRRHCMFILGNPPSMLKGQRFVEENLNRLFSKALETNKAPANYEQYRAHEIMDAVTAFLDGHTRAPIHYDLHTAIRPSRFEKFAVFPFLPARPCAKRQLRFLGNSEIRAILLQNKPATTFSGWTAQQFGAESFTLELGKVSSFGDNDPSKLAAIENQLFKLLASTPGAETGEPKNYPEQYVVVDEIIITGDDFVLNIEENTANFTSLENGYEVWRDNKQCYEVSDGPYAIVFPNSKVASGQRAGLLVKIDQPVLV